MLKSQECKSLRVSENHEEKVSHCQMVIEIIEFPTDCEGVDVWFSLVTNSDYMYYKIIFTELVTIFNAGTEVKLPNQLPQKFTSCSKTNNFHS